MTMQEKRKPNIIAEGPVRKAKAVYLCKGCGWPHVSWDEDKQPDKCRNGKCSWSGADPKTGSIEQWLKSSDNAAIAPIELPAEPPAAEPEPPVQIGGATVDLSDVGTTRTMTSEQFRSEWVAEWVQQATLAALGSTRTFVAEEEWWEIAEHLYDAGKKRGHLP